MTMSTTMIKDNIITLVRCLERFALTSSSQAAGSSDWGNLLVQAWKMEKLDIALLFDRCCCCCLWKMDDVDAVLILGSASLDNVDHADMICF